MMLILIVWDDDNKDLVPLEFDDNQIIMTDDGDVILLDQDNMQVEGKPIVPLSGDVVMLPPEENMTDVISTRNIVKRKQPPPTAQIKQIKNETEILVRDTPNEGELVVALPPKTEEISNADIIQHPIFRRLKKNKDQADGRIISSVDISTMRQMSWVDFTTILDNTEVHLREQVILDILQNNLPKYSVDDLYYIHHDPENNVFCIKIDETAEEIQDFIGSIMLINAQLKVETLSAKERERLIKKRKLKIKELRKTYNADAAADVLEKKLSESEKKSWKKI